MVDMTEFKFSNTTDFLWFLLICWEISITITYFKEYNENIAIQLCTILHNIANFGNYGKTRVVTLVSSNCAATSLAGELKM